MANIIGASQLNGDPKAQSMSMTEKTFVQRTPEPKDELAELLTRANKAFLEQRQAECGFWIKRIYATLDKEQS